MTDVQSPQDDRVPTEASEAATPLGRSAKRLSGWAVNLLATGIVVAAGLTFGRQVLIWWNAAPVQPDVANIAGPMLGDEAQRHLLEFGDVPFALQREVLEGDRRAAVNQLLVRCREAAQAGVPPAAEMGPSEAALLRRLEHSPPLAVGNHDEWQLFALEKPLPVAAAVVELPSPEDSVPRKRVVSWGLALPVGWDSVPTLPETSETSQDGRWTLFTWSASAAVRAASIDAPPLPRGAQRLMRLAAEDGSALVAFRGGGTPRDVIDFYNERFLDAPQDEAWTEVSSWREIGGVWHARFERHEQTVDVQLIVRDGELSGMLTLTAAGASSAARNNYPE